MPVTTAWRVNTCDFHDVDPLTKVITNIHASCQATDGTNTTRWLNKVFSLGEPDPMNFTDFDTLDEAALLAMADADEKAQHEAAAERTLSDQIADEAANTGTGLPSGMAG